MIRQNSEIWRCLTKVSETPRPCGTGKVSCRTRQHFARLSSFSDAINIFFFLFPMLLVHAFSCTSIELQMHLGSLERTHEARVALGYRFVQLFTSLVLSKLHASFHSTVIVRKRAKYRRIPSRRGQRLSWLKCLAISRKLEHYNCFIIQHIDNKPVAVNVAF